MIVSSQTIKKNRIVHVISSLARGGAEIVLLDLIKGLPDFEHHVIYIHDGPIRQALENDTIACISIRGWFFTYDLGIIIRLYKLLKTIRPDSIHSSLWAANFFTRLCARLLDIPLINVIHAHLPHQGKVRTFLDSMTFWLSDTVVAVSPSIFSSLQKTWWVKKSSLKLIENGIHTDRISQRTSSSRDRSIFTLLAVGRFIPAKNFRFLLEVFNQLIPTYSDMRLMILGYGPEQQTLENYRTHYGLEKNVQIIVGQEAALYYGYADCFVQPSLTEGLSIALLEAMSAGIACIVSGNDQHDVITQGKTGLIVPANDHEAWKKAISFCYQEKSTAQELGKAAQLAIQHRFSASIMAQKYRALFEKNIRIGNKFLDVKNIWEKV